MSEYDITSKIKFKNQHYLYFIFTFNGNCLCKMVLNLRSLHDDLIFEILCKLRYNTIGTFSLINKRNLTIYRYGNGRGVIKKVVNSYQLLFTGVSNIIFLNNLKFQFSMGLEFTQVLQHPFLLKACLIGDLSTVTFLIKNGIDIHANHNQALSYSALNGHLEIVKLLIVYGANMLARDSHALRYSSLNGHLEIVKLLIACGANVLAYNGQALQLACLNGHLKIVQLLIGVGANVDDYSLELATENSHIEVVKILKMYLEH